MYHDFNYEATLASSLRAQWQLDDVLREDQDLDFSRNFLPESLARTAALGSLNAFEQRTLNQIAAHEYLSMFGIVEEFLLPFVLDHARPHLMDDDWRVRALAQLRERGSEAHPSVQALPRGVQARLPGRVPGDRPVRGDRRRKSSATIRSRSALVILMIEWMTQQHYLGSIRDDSDLDPLFKSLMKHHWIEESQHAKLDTLIVDALAEGRTEEQIDKAIDEFFEIGAFLDDGLKAQAGFNLDALEKVLGRKLPEPRRDRGAAAPGRALDLRRLRHGPRALQGHASQHFGERRGPHRGSRSGLRLNPINPRRI